MSDNLSLLNKMESKFDPSDTDAAQRLAYKALRLMRLAQQAVDSDNAGLRMGRDQKGDLFSAIVELAGTLGILDAQASAEEIQAFSAALIA